MRSQPPRPQLVAHRGAKLERPENTLAAFARAIELGADALELDVHATRDGVVVVHHDPVPRATRRDGSQEVHPFPLLSAAEVADLRVADQRIPALTEVLALAGPRVTVYVEIKGAGIEALVVDVVRRGGAPCAIHSFDHDAIGRVRLLAPEIPRGLLFETPDEPMLDAMARYAARDLWPHFPLVDQELIDRAHAAGYRVIPWTVNDRASAARLAAFGADALCGDDVPLLRAAARRVGG